LESIDDLGVQDESARVPSTRHERILHLQLFVAKELMDYSFMQVSHPPNGLPGERNQRPTLWKTNFGN